MKSENNTIVIALIAVLIVLSFGFISPYGMMGNYSGYGMMSRFFPAFGFMWIFGGLFMILIAIALILFIVWLIKQIQGGKK